MIIDENFMETKQAEILLNCSLIFLERIADTVLKIQASNEKREIKTFDFFWEHYEFEVQVIHSNNDLESIKFTLFHEDSEFLQIKHQIHTIHGEDWAYLYVNKEGKILNINIMNSEKTNLVFKKIKKIARYIKKKNRCYISTNFSLTKEEQELLNQTEPVMKQKTVIGSIEIDSSGLLQIIEENKEVLTEEVVSIIREKYTHMLEKIASHKETLDVEKQHNMNRLLKQDFNRLIQQFVAMNEENRKKELERFLNTLEQMAKSIDSIIEEGNVRSFNKVVRLNELRYAN